MLEDDVLGDLALADGPAGDGAEHGPDQREDHERPQLLEGVAGGEHRDARLRAGFTDVLSTGMVIKWISVSVGRRRARGRRREAPPSC